MNRAFFSSIRFWLFMIVVLFLFSSPLRAQTDGPALFKAKCAACHGPDGKGQVPMGKTLGARDLTSADVQKQTDAELTEVVIKGRKKMPAYETKLSKEQITQLVAYIREIGKKH
jgi:mono/diheme cytochrome c family protein